MLIKPSRLRASTILKELRRNPRFTQVVLYGRHMQTEPLAGTVREARKALPREVEEKTLFVRVPPRETAVGYNERAFARFGKLLREIKNGKARVPGLPQEEARRVAIAVERMIHDPKKRGELAHLFHDYDGSVRFAMEKRLGSAKTKGLEFLANEFWKLNVKDDNEIVRELRKRRADIEVVNLHGLRAGSAQAVYYGKEAERFAKAAERAGVGAETRKPVESLHHLIELPMAKAVGGAGRERKPGRDPAMVASGLGTHFSTNYDRGQFLYNYLDRAGHYPADMERHARVIAEFLRELARTRKRN